MLPLVLPLAGLLKHRLYTYRWVSLLVWLYFAEGIVRATGLPATTRPTATSRPPRPRSCSGSHGSARAATSSTSATADGSR